MGYYSVLIYSSDRLSVRDLRPLTPGVKGLKVLFLQNKSSCLLLSTDLLDLGLDTGVSLGLGELLLLVLLGLSSVLGLGLLGRRLVVGVGSDLLVGSGEDLLNGVGIDLVVKVRLEDLSESLLIIISKLLHVLGNVAGEDVLSQGLGIELLGLDIPTGESRGGVGNVKSTIGSTLENTEALGTGGGSGHTDIKENLEGSRTVLNGLGELVLTLNLLNSLVGLVEAELLKSSSGNKKTNGVGGSPVGKTVLDTVSGELVSVGSGENNVTLELRRHNLGNDVLVGESDNKSVLGGVVLGLVLGHESLSSIIVGLTFSSSTEGGLEPRVVSRGLDNLVERHC